ncbi:MAG: hypothetical protein V7L04_14045 [Nostoc sp.]|uniref:hypothetical protein n=1 Tax=Nostoc sp. TaxID=1180 RepID=UPI002FFA23A4
MIHYAFNNIRLQPYNESVADTKQQIATLPNADITYPHLGSYPHEKRIAFVTTKCDRPHQQAEPK